MIRGVFIYLYLECFFNNAPVDKIIFLIYNI